MVQLRSLQQPALVQWRPFRIQHGPKGVPSREVRPCGHVFVQANQKSSVLRRLSLSLIGVTFHRQSF